MCGVCVFLLLNSDFVIVLKDLDRSGATPQPTGVLALPMRPVHKSCGRATETDGFPDVKNICTKYPLANPLKVATFDLVSSFSRRQLWHLAQS